MQTPMCASCSPYWQWVCGLSQLDITHTVSLGVAQHIAGNILREIVYVLLARRGPVKSRVEGLWPLTLEAYRLDTATI